MTPKEKAKELYDKYEKIFVDANADSWGKEAKQSALICIDEILNETNINGDERNFWLAVKEEINAL